MLKSSMNSEKNKKNRKNIWIMGTVFFSIVGLFIIIQAASGLYPFGDKTNMLWDQDIQYVDYFAFYKDVLLGKASIGYSFSKSLGGSLMALFGYYLSCPLNVFVVFFSKDQMPLFLFILTAVKLGLAGVTIEYFLRKRFVSLPNLMRVLLPVAYGLMQYVMIQASNIMWLDGVILLPLLLLAVYRFVTNQKRTGLFFMVLLCIVVNWYTGYMTLLFAICYFLYERGLLIECIEKGTWKKLILDTLHLGCVMFCGLLGSCFIFYPIVKGLQNGKQAFSLAIFAPSVNGSFLDLFRGFALGSVISVVALYCGLLVLGFVVYYFVSGRIQSKEKIFSALAALFMLVSCWFVPFECIWSGMRYAGSYRYRYSFIVVFLLIYLAAKGTEVFEMKKDARKMAAIFGIGALVFLLFRYKNTYDQVGLMITAGFLAVYCLLFLVLGKQRCIQVIIPLVFAVELILNGVMTFHIQYMWNPDISQYQEYVQKSEAQIAEIKKAEESEFYRMDTLQKRYDEENKCSAFLNESMVYGYHGINHYSSTFDTPVGEMIHEIGYSTEIDLSIMSESSLPADSILGVKYLLSKENVPGYEKLDMATGANGKSVYYNPYALGLGMQAADTVYEKAESENPFEYQNQLYSNILGRRVELYKKAESSDSIENHTLSCDISATGQDNLLYGYVSSNKYEDEQGMRLSIDGEYRCDYACWLSYKVFYVGTGSKEHTVTLEQEPWLEEELNSYFYYLDQPLFEEVIEELKSKQMTTTMFDDGHVKGNYSAEDAGNLLLTIPFDSGWRASVNGKDVEIKEAANAMMTLPVTQGENVIELKYHVPGVKSGIVLSVIGIVLFVLFFSDQSKRVRKNERKKW